MYLALQIGSVDLNPIVRGVVATILYFLVGMAVLILSLIHISEPTRPY